MRAAQIDGGAAANIIEETIILMQKWRKAVIIMKVETQRAGEVKIIIAAKSPKSRSIENNQISCVVCSRQMAMRLVAAAKRMSSDSYIIVASRCRRKLK